MSLRMIPRLLKRPATRREKGMALLLVMVVTTTLLIMGGMFMAAARAELMSAAYYRQATQSEQYALVGLQRAMAELMYDVWGASENVPFKTSRPNPITTLGVDPTTEATYRNLMLRDQYAFDEGDEALYGVADGTKDAAYYVTRGTRLGTGDTTLEPIAYQRGFWTGEAWAVWLDDAGISNGNGDDDEAIANLESSPYRKSNTVVAAGGLGLASHAVGATALHREPKWLRACAFRRPYDYIVGFDRMTDIASGGAHYDSALYDGIPNNDSHDAAGYDLDGDGDVDADDRFNAGLDMNGDGTLDVEDIDYRNWAWFQLLCDAYLPETTDTHDCFQLHLHLDDRDTFTSQSSRSAAAAADGLIPPDDYDYGFEKVSHLLVGDSFYRIFRFDLVYYDPAFEKTPGYRYPYDRAHTGFGGQDPTTDAPGGDPVTDAANQDPTGNMLNINEVNNDYSFEALWRDDGAEQTDFTWFHKKEAKWIYVYQPTLSARSEYVKPGRYAVTVVPDNGQPNINAVKTRQPCTSYRQDTTYLSWLGNPNTSTSANRQLTSDLDYFRFSPVDLFWDMDYDQWDPHSITEGGAVSHHNYSAQIGPFLSRAEYSAYQRKHAWGADLPVADGGDNNGVPNSNDGELEYVRNASWIISQRISPFGYRYTLGPYWDHEMLVLGSADRNYGKPRDGTAAMCMFRRNTADGINDAAVGNPGLGPDSTGSEYGSWIGWDEGVKGEVSVQLTQRATALRQRFLAFLDQVQWNPGYRPPSGEHKVLDWLFGDTAAAPSARRKKFRATVLTNVLSSMNYYAHGDHCRIIQIAACPNGHVLAAPGRLDYSDPDKMVDLNVLDPTLGAENPAYLAAWGWAAGGCPACGERMYLNEWSRLACINEIGKIRENFWDARRDYASEADYLALNPGALMDEVLDNQTNQNVPFHYGGTDKDGANNRPALERFFIELLLPYRCTGGNHGIGRADDEVSLMGTHFKRSQVRATTNNEVREFGLQPEPLFLKADYHNRHTNPHLLIWDPTDGDGRWHDVFWFHGDWGRVKHAATGTTGVGDDGRTVIDFADTCTDTGDANHVWRCHKHRHVHHDPATPGNGYGSNALDHAALAAPDNAFHATETDGDYGRSPGANNAEKYKWTIARSWIHESGHQTYRRIDPFTPDPANSNPNDPGYFWMWNGAPDGQSERVVNGPGSPYIDVAGAIPLLEIQRDWCSDGAGAGGPDGKIDGLGEQVPVWVATGNAVPNTAAPVLPDIPTQPTSSIPGYGPDGPTGKIGIDMDGGGFQPLRQEAYEWAERGADLSESLPPSYRMNAPCPDPTTPELEWYHTSHRPICWTGGTRPHDHPASGTSKDPKPCLLYTGDRDDDGSTADKIDLYGGGYSDDDLSGTRDAGEAYLPDGHEDFPMNWHMPLAGSWESTRMGCLGWDEGPVRLRCDTYYIEDDDRDYHGARLIDAPDGVADGYKYWAYPERPVRVYGGATAAPYVMKYEYGRGTDGSDSSFGGFRWVSAGWDVNGDGEVDGEDDVAEPWGHARTSYGNRGSRDGDATRARAAGVMAFRDSNGLRDDTDDATRAATDDSIDDTTTAEHRWDEDDYIAYTGAGRKDNIHRYWYWEPIGTITPWWQRRDCTDEAWTHYHYSHDCAQAVEWLYGSTHLGRRWGLTPNGGFNVADSRYIAPPAPCPPDSRDQYEQSPDSDDSAQGAPFSSYSRTPSAIQLNSPDQYITLTFDTRFQGTRIVYLREHDMDTREGVVNTHGKVQIWDYVELRDPANGNLVNMSTIPVGQSWQARNPTDNRTNYVDGYTCWDLMDITLSGETLDSRLDPAQPAPALGQNCGGADVIFPAESLPPGIDLVNIHWLTDAKVVAASQVAATGLRISGYVDYFGNNADATYWAGYDPFCPGNNHRNNRNRNFYWGGVQGSFTTPALGWDISDAQGSYDLHVLPHTWSSPGGDGDPSGMVRPCVGPDSPRGRWENMISHMGFDNGNFSGPRSFLQTPTGIGMGTGNNAPYGVNTESRFDAFSFNSLYDFFHVSDFIDYYQFHGDFGLYHQGKDDRDFTDMDFDGITDGNRTTPVTYKHMNDADGYVFEEQVINVNLAGAAVATSQGDYNMDMRTCININVNELQDNDSALEVLVFGYGSPEGWPLYGSKPLRGYPSIGWNYAFCYDQGWGTGHIYRRHMRYDPDHDRSVDYYSAEFGGGSGIGWQSDQSGSRGQLNIVYAGVSPVHTVYVTGQSLGITGEPMGEVRIRCSVERTWDGRMRVLEFNWIAQDIGLWED